MAVLHVLTLGVLLGLAGCQESETTTADALNTPSWDPPQGLPPGLTGPAPRPPIAGPPLPFPPAGGPPPPFPPAGGPPPGAGGPPKGLPDFLKNCPPEPPTVADFNVTAYLGNWYEQKTVPAWFSPNSSCVRAQYGINGEGKITVYNVGTKANGEFEDIKGTAEAPSPAAPAALLVTFPIGSGQGTGIPGKYNVIATDYTSYAIVHSCPLEWILTREANPPKELVEQGVDVLRSNGIDISKLRDTFQGETCKYDP